ncbi:MAG: asparagine synthase (glutamine-hydrolyzing) [Defluviitaleaceae bacterium]|nr:asparagine synthase (glutamine-hydrolyzing) [Defluviitaleaceae bacterium]
MCGFIGFTGNREDREQVTKDMNSKIYHRGPDGEGYFFDNNINFGFRRLSFLDLTHGNQPMTTECGRYTIMFNGEIYNYRALRSRLEEKGRTFTTKSDTEVILQMYVEYGVHMLNQLRGMFAIVIYDKQTSDIFAARDHFGIKPFYYSIFGGELLFGSEIKGLLEHPDCEKNVNHAALSGYLAFQYSPLTETMFKDIHKLQPAHFLRFSGGKLTIERYWQAEFAPAKVSRNKKKAQEQLEAAVREIDEVLGESIDLHYNMSDVEIGSFLSSGVDSSLIAARFDGEKTFTVGFDYDGYNEIEYAQELSKDMGLTHHSRLITTTEYWDNLGKIQYHMDEPLADPAAVALYFVSEEARKHVKGVLSGEGADEFFGGYNIYQEPRSLRPMKVFPKFVRRGLGAVAKKLPAFKGRNYFIRAAQPVEQRFIGNAYMFTEAERKELLKEKDFVSAAEITAPYYAKTKGYDDVTKMQYIDIHMWMVGDILLKADKMTMAHCLEGRVPILDKEVFAVAAKLPTKFRVTKKETKYAFRLAAAKYLDEKWSKKRKLGFPVPIRLWLRESEYYARVKMAFESKAAQEFFNTDKLVALLDAHKLNKADNSRKIWTLYMFLLWHKEFFGDCDGNEC